MIFQRELRYVYSMESPSLEVGPSAIMITYAKNGMLAKYALKAITPGDSFIMLLRVNQSPGTAPYNSLGREKTQMQAKFSDLL